MYDLLRGMRVVECASFVAGPSCTLHLAQLGAEVIRIDAIGGGPDHHRWPVAPNGASLYWEGLNKGKKSIAVDLSRPEGRDLAVRLITAPGHGGLFVTNYPASGFLAHDKLAARRADLITIRVMGWADGTPAVDYTVNAAVGIPFMTGPAELGDAPVNHVLPAWDLLTGAYAAFALVAAERHRRATGNGQEVRLPLGSMAIASVSHLGQIGDVHINGGDRPRTGNALFGAFGRDFRTREGVRVMLIAITPRQWSGLLSALDLDPAIADLERELGASFARDEGLRFIHRDRLMPLVEAAMAERSLEQLTGPFERLGVCWERFRTLKQAIDEDPRFTTANPILSDMAHPSGHRYPAAGAAADFMDLERAQPRPAPHLGQHTDDVLADVLGLPAHDIARMHDAGIVAGASLETSKSR